MAVRKVGGTRKKSSKKTTHRRKRRRISGVSDAGGMLMKAAGVIAGSIAARELNTLAVGISSSVTPTLSGIGQMAIGYFLPKLVKSPFVADMGLGMIANGGMVLVVSTGIISGPTDRIAFRVNGVSNLPVIGKTGRLPSVNGVSNLPVIGGPTTRISAQPTGLTTPVPRVFNQTKMAHYV
jgi:hypothetical protein